MELAAAVGNSIRTARGAHRTLCFVHARWQSMSGRNTRDKWTCVTDWQEQLHLHAVLCQCAVRGEDDPVPWQQVSAASAGRVHYSRLTRPGWAGLPAADGATLCRQLVFCSAESPAAVVNCHLQLSQQ
jgi:hypothetical protein